MTQSPRIYTDSMTGAKVRAFFFREQESWKGELDCVVTIPVHMDSAEMVRPMDLSGLWDKEEFGKRFQ